MNTQAYSLAGAITFALRLVVGWTYFSAFLRRIVLENKLLPDAPGYIGEKFNHFLPNSIGIKPLIEHLVTHPGQLWWAMLFFTFIEGIVGLLCMLGFLTRLMSVGISLLACGILLGSGWLGTTCLDEWQIGILGVVSGFTLFLAGGGPYSLDRALLSRLAFVQNRSWAAWLTSGTLPLEAKTFRTVTVTGAIAIFALSLYTNQVFHNGVWGPLHNKSVKPRVEISDMRLTNEELAFTVYRVEGVDVYGSFLIGIGLQNEQGETVFRKGADELASFPEQQIRNRYIARIKPGPHSLVLPLGGKAELVLYDPEITGLPAGNYTLVLTDISGATWKQAIAKTENQ